MMVIQHGRLLSLSKPIAPQVLLMRLVQHSVKLMNLLKVHRFKFPTICSYYCKIMLYAKIFISVLICRFVKTILTTKLTTVINQKVHGHFQQQIMGGQYQTVLLKHWRSGKIFFMFLIHLKTRLCSSLVKLEVMCYDIMAYITNFRQ
jgi:hypothetical protein